MYSRMILSAPPVARRAAEIAPAEKTQVRLGGPVKRSGKWKLLVAVMGAMLLVCAGAVGSAIWGLRVLNSAAADALIDNLNTRQ